MITDGEDDLTCRNVGSYISYFFETPSAVA
jgi:hypothetical protein